jgi:hypothetical protein
MKQINVNEKRIYFEAYMTPEPFILLSDNEQLSNGYLKAYSLHRFSIKYAMEDYVKYLEKVKEYKIEREKPTTPF